MARRASPLVGADETLFVPTEQLRGYRPNRAPVARKRRIEPAADLYAGQEGFLVRTALIRSEDYSPEKAVELRTPAATAKLCAHLAFADQEHIVTLTVDACNRLLAIHESGIGGTSSTAAELRHLVKIPLLTGARGAIIVHNHPSGNIEMSIEDQEMLRVLLAAFGCLRIPLLDFMVVARDGYSSALELGLLRGSREP